MRAEANDIDRLARKQQQGRKTRPAAGQGGTQRVLPPPREPMAVARAFLAEGWRYPDGALLLRHWRGGWWSWRTSHWRECEPRAVRGLLYAFTETAVYQTLTGARAWEPNRHRIDDVLDALAAICLLANYVDQPVWLDGRASGTIVACANGLLDVETRELLPHDPSFFNVVSVPFDYDPAARVPYEWREFLKALWPQDSESRRALAQWFGYTVSGRLDLQKILLMVGPTRAGKGLIARILGALIGPKNVAAPTLSSLAGDFGMAPLIGKSLAVISDARLSGRHGSVVVERLLSISGEDFLTVNIKYREQWTGKLPCRVFLISNELPEFGDASGATANRFIVLQLTTSWLGREDIELETRIRAQLPGVLNWALMGLANLERRGRFTQPRSAQEAITTLLDLVSPVRAFVRDRCEVGPDHEVEIGLLYATYRQWADDNGHPKIAKTTFGKNLRAVLPRVRVAQPRTHDPKKPRSRVYCGLQLRP
jgi:putative DNA primase/helicase